MIGFWDIERSAHVRAVEIRAERIRIARRVGGVGEIADVVR